MTTDRVCSGTLIMRALSLLFVVVVAAAAIAQDAAPASPSPQRATKTVKVEFRWAEFFRSRIPFELVKCDFAHALILAMHFAGRAEAAGLPGLRAPAETTIAPSCSTQHFEQACSQD